MKWAELTPGNRSSLTQMFANYSYLHGCVASILYGGMGTALVDNPAEPKIGLLHCEDFYIFAGEPIRTYVEDKLNKIIIVPNGEWEQVLKQIKGDQLHASKRVAFAAGRWQSNDLRSHIQKIPDDFTINRVTHTDIIQFAELDKSFVDNFPSHASFLQAGIGFCVKHGTQIVAGCSSYLIGGGKLEIEIRTHPDFRRRGLATAIAATMIEHCLAHDLEPCWDAANQWSASLAEKLGFINPQAYNAYWIES